MTPLLPRHHNSQRVTEQALTTLLILLHCYALRHDPTHPNPRLAQAILCQLEQLAEDPALGESLRRTCDQLHDAWLPLSRSTLLRNWRA